jgi:hypothetical protein
MKSIDIKKSLQKVVPRVDVLGNSVDLRKVPGVANILDIVNAKAKDIGCGIFSEDYDKMRGPCNSSTQSAIDRVNGVKDITARCNALLMSIIPHLDSCLYDINQSHPSSSENSRLQSLANAQNEVNIILQICDQIISTFNSQDKTTSFSDIAKDLQCAVPELLDTLKTTLTKATSYSALIKEAQNAGLDYFREQAQKTGAATLSRFPNLDNPFASSKDNMYNILTGDARKLANSLGSPCLITALMKAKALTNHLDLYALGEDALEAFKEEFENDLPSCLQQAIKNKNLLKDRSSIFGRLNPKAMARDFVEDKAKAKISFETGKLKSQLISRVKNEIPVKYKALSELGFSKNNKFNSILGTTAEIQNAMHDYTTYISQAKLNVNVTDNVASQVNLENDYLEALIKDTVGGNYASADSLGKTQHKLAKAILAPYTPTVSFHF